MLLITGQIGAGKDSLAQNLQYNYGLNFSIKRAFADKLKATVRDLYGIPTHLLWGSQNDKKAPTHIRKPNSEEYYTVRELVCAFSDACKAIDNNCWARVIGDFINACISTPNDCVGYWKNYEYFFISDWRHEHEKEFLISYCPNTDIKTLKLLRKGDYIPHNSEDMVNKETATFDWVLDNNNLTINETRNQAINLIDGWIKS